MQNVNNQIQKNDNNKNHFNIPDKNTMIEKVQDDNDPKFNFYSNFSININDLWNYFKFTSFFPSYFYENCKIMNIQKLGKTINLNDILDLQFQDKNINIKIQIENIIDTPYYKSYTQKTKEVPEGISPFSINISLYLCSVHQISGVNIKIVPFEIQKNTFVYDYIFQNHKKIFQNIQKFIEKNFTEYEQAESISIQKSGDDVWDFIIKNNYSNLKLFLGNNAKVRATNIPNQIEVEHFTKNNIVRMEVSKKLEFNEKNLILKVITSTRQIPKQKVLLKIVNINKNSCLLVFTHKIEQFLDSDSLNNYSLIKQKTLWLLKSSIEDNNTS